MNAHELARGIGNFFGDYFEEDGKFCIDNGETVLRYDTAADLLKDWVDTLVENHHDTADNPKSNQLSTNDSWEQEIIFIYEDVIGKYPPGIRRYNDKDGTPKWQSSIDVKEPGNTHGKNLHLGTYCSIVDAIYARQNFLRQMHANSISDISTLAKMAEDMRSEARVARVQMPSSEKKLIEAMAEYGLDNSWNDSDIIDVLVDCGITHEDFKKCGYGNFVKEYFEDNRINGTDGIPLGVDQAPIENATFVSVWDGGFCVETECKVNRATGEVFDIEISEGTADMVNNLETEFIRFADGSEHVVEQGCVNGGFWYGDAETIELKDEQPIFVAIFNSHENVYELLSSYSEALEGRFSKECSVSLINGDTLCFRGLNGQEISDLMESTGADYNYSYESAEDAWFVEGENSEISHIELSTPEDQSQAAGLDSMIASANKKLQEVHQTTSQRSAPER